MSTFVATMQDTDLWEDWGVRLVSTHANGSVLHRLFGFVRGTLLFVLELTFRRPSVVHLNSAAYGSFFRKGLLAWTAKLFRVPVVFHMHGADFLTFYSDSPRRIQTAIRVTLERVDAVVALGSAWASSIGDIAPAANVVVIPNAVRPQSPVTHHRDGPVRVLFLGEVGERKGTFTLIESWSKITSLTADSSPARLTIAGDGEVEKARAQVTALGLDSTVDVRGWLPPSEVAKLLAETQILVLPSRDEGQPMAILEAMARGICVIASGVGGIPEMLSQDSGLVVAPDDVDGLTQAVCWMIADGDARSAVGKNAHARIRADFDVDVVSLKFNEIYRSLSERSRN